MRPEIDAKPAAEIEPKQLKRPNSTFASKHCLEEFSRKNTSKQFFALKMINEWVENSMQKIQYLIDVNPDAVVVTNNGERTFASTCSSTAFLREAMTAIETCGVDAFDFNEDKAPTGQYYLSRTMDEVNLENDTEASDALLNHINKCFDNNLTRPFSPREVTTKHGSFKVTHFVRVER